MKNLKISDFNEFEVSNQSAQNVKGGGCVATIDWDKVFDGTPFNAFDKCPKRVY